MSDARLAGISPWLDKLWDLGGTDLLLSPESAPRVRVDGRLKPIEGAPLLTGDQITDIALPILTDGQRAIFEESLTSTSRSRGWTGPESVATCSPSAVNRRWRCGSSPQGSPPTRNSAFRPRRPGLPISLVASCW